MGREGICMMEYFSTIKKLDILPFAKLAVSRGEVSEGTGETVNGD